MAKLLVSITNAKNDTDRATVGCVVANASVASGVDTVIFLSTEGVRLSQEGYADDIHAEGFAPVKKLLTDLSMPVGLSGSARRASRSAAWTKTSWSPVRPSLVVPRPLNFCPPGPGPRP